MGTTWRGSAPSGSTRKRGGGTPRGNQRSGDAGNSGQHERFDQQLTQHMPSPRAERRTHGELTATGRCARQLQTGHVGARDEQKQQHRREKRDNQPRRRAKQRVLERHDLHAALAVGVGVLPLELGGDTCQIILRLRE